MLFDYYIVWILEINPDRKSPNILCVKEFGVKKNLQVFL